MDLSDKTYHEQQSPNPLELQGALPPEHPVTPSPYSSNEEQPTQAYPPYQEPVQAPNPYAQQVPPSQVPYNGGPYGGQPPQMYPQNNADRWNTMVIVGFILSFFTGIIGAILSAVGLSQIKKTGEKSKGLAIAGIVIGSVSTLVSIIVTIVMIVTGASLFHQAINDASPNSSYSHIAPRDDTQDRDDAYDDSDYDDMDLDDLGDVDSDALPDLHKGMTFEDVFNNPTLRKQIDEQTNSLPDGLKIDVNARGNTIIYDVTITDKDMQALPGDTMGNAMIDAMKPYMSSLCDQLDITDGKLQINITNADGKQMYSKTENIQ